MLCYKDRVYCSSDCTNVSCDRYLSEEIKSEAKRLGLWIQISNLSEDCVDYDMPENYDQPKEEQDG